MATEKPKHSVSVEAGQHPEAKIIDNPPTSSVSEALANSAKQVDATKRK